MCLSTDDGSSKPFADLPANLKNRRMSRAMDELFTPADDAHLSSLGKFEIDALHESWAEDKDDMAKAKEEATTFQSQRNSVNRALKDVKAELEVIKGRLKTSEARIGEILSSQNRLKEKIVEEWKNSEEGEAHNVEIGLEATTVVTSDTLRRVQLALAEFAPSIGWDEIQGKYDSILAKEREDLRAQLVA
ncbi:hypothetical protein SOVF_082710 [Spinacia oleracea]|nr:hypothetical protein SOVF_082710 [Spinacia oleracea]